jgi:uncharacterized protein YciW
VGTERRWTTFGAALRFEEAARNAEKRGNHRLAAALYRAALLVLNGRLPEDQANEALVDAGCIASARGEAPRRGKLPRAPD